MRYTIEVMSLGEDMYPLLERAAAGLNGIQDQFRFEVTRQNQRAAGLEFRRNEYLTTDVWSFLRAQRERRFRPFIIAFVSRPLRSEKYKNLFGSHEGENGLAVVTTFGAAHYVKEAERYCRYYLVRYALSFVNWLIRAHNDPANADCYFNFKRDKRELVLSMDSGRICDDCLDKLDNPPTDSKVYRLTDEDRAALRKMRQHVSGEYPYALVMKGGGIKGLALAGALIELENHFYFDRHVGTSAGAIAAVLLAAEYKPDELKELFLAKDFTDFLDAPLWKLPFFLFGRWGLYPGEAFQRWMADLLTQKLGMMAEVRMKHFVKDSNRGAVIYAARVGQGTLTFDSTGENKDAVASFAVRCSMSIPYFFMPMSVDGRRVFDGGLRHNFPLKVFLETHGSNAPFIGLYLGKPDNSNNDGFVASNLLDIAVNQEEKQLVDEHRRDVVVIDTTPIGTVDFRLTTEEKDFLVTVGRVSALEMLLARRIDNGPQPDEVCRLRDEAEKMRESITEQRSMRRERRLLTAGFVAFVVVDVLIFAFG